MALASDTPILMVVLDGLGDRPQPDLGGLTPLEAAETPNLDALAALGTCGRLYPLSPGLAPSSHQAHFALFGYDEHDFPGRGLLEALGCEVPPAPGEVVLRANLARAEVSDGVWHITERPDPRTGEAGLEKLNLDAEIDGVRVRFVFTDHLQGLLFLSPASGTAGLSHFVSDADPLRADFPVLSVRPLEEAPDPVAAERTARVLNAWMRLAHERLVPCDIQLESVAECTLNFMLVKWAGMRTHVTPFRARYGLRGASLGSGPLYRGLAEAVGLVHVAVPAEHDPEHDLAGRVAVAQDLIGSGTTDFVHVHTKWPDSAGHRKDPARKRDVIAALDRALAPLVDIAGRGEAVVAVVADHQTPSAGPLYHGGGAVPIIVAGGTLGADHVRAYGETACAAGLLGTLRGVDLMPVLLDAADRSAFLADRMTAAFALGAPRLEDLEPLRVETDGI